MEQSNPVDTPEHRLSVPTWTQAIRTNLNTNYQYQPEHKLSVQTWTQTIGANQNIHYRYQPENVGTDQMSFSRMLALSDKSSIPFVTVPRMWAEHNSIPWNLCNTLVHACPTTHASTSISTTYATSGIQTLMQQWTSQYLRNNKSTRTIHIRHTLRWSMHTPEQWTFLFAKRAG